VACRDQQHGIHSGGTHGQGRGAMRCTGMIRERFPLTMGPQEGEVPLAGGPHNALAGWVGSG
jgi:hypothetical protein